MLGASNRKTFFINLVKEAQNYVLVQLHWYFAQRIAPGGRVILGTKCVNSCRWGFYFFIYYRGGQQVEGSVGHWHGTLWAAYIYRPHPPLTFLRRVLVARPIATRRRNTLEAFGLSSGVGHSGVTIRLESSLG